MLSVLDGILIQTTSNVHDFGLAKLNKDDLSDMWRLMPTRFKRQKGNMRYLTSHNAEQDYRNSIASRAYRAASLQSAACIISSASWV